MAEWRPTIGKWCDEDHYSIIKPAWRRMLDAASEYEEVKTVQTILTRLGRRNITAYDIQGYVIGYLLHQRGVDLKNDMPDSMIAQIHAFSSRSQNIYDYTVLVLKECHVSDAVIEEFVEEMQADNSFPLAKD